MTDHRFRVYVASWFENSPMVRVAHTWLRTLGVTPTSRWAEDARGPEDWRAMTQVQLLNVRADNYCDLASSDLLLVIAGDKSGETFAEAMFAIERKMPVLWVGRRILSANAECVRLIEPDDSYVPRNTGDHEQYWNHIASAMVIVTAKSIAKADEVKADVVNAVKNFAR